MLGVHRFIFMDGFANNILINLSNTLMCLIHLTNNVGVIEYGHGEPCRVRNSVFL